MRFSPGGGGGGEGADSNNNLASNRQKCTPRIRIGLTDFSDRVRVYNGAREILRYRGVKRRKKRKKKKINVYYTRKYKK